MKIKLVYNNSLGIPTLNRVLDAVVEKFDNYTYGISVLYIHRQIHLDDISDKLKLLGLNTELIKEEFSQTLIVTE